MARRRRRKSGRWLVAALVLVAAGLLAWQQRARIAALLPAGGKAPVNVSAQRIEPANDGREIRVAGRLEATGPARDAEFGISASAALLVRTVEMYQWRERCGAGGCSYDQAWSAQPIDAKAFRQPQGHDNPAPRLKSATFAADGLHLGAFRITPALLAARPTLELPVHVADLPPNLAATFADSDGRLFAGGDPAQPQVGEVRVSYRVVPIGEIEVTGIQRGDAIATD